MKQTNRGLRRALRQRAIAHAFNVYWNMYGDGPDVFDKRHWHGYEPTTIENQAERWEIENNHRDDVMRSATRVADYLKSCSCAMCTHRYGKYKTPQIKRARAKDIEDIRYYFEN